MSRFVEDGDTLDEEMDGTGGTRWVVCQTCDTVWYFSLPPWLQRQGQEKQEDGTTKARQEGDRPDNCQAERSHEAVNQKKLLQNLLVDASDKLKAPEHSLTIDYGCLCDLASSRLGRRGRLTTRSPSTRRRPSWRKGLQRNVCSPKARRVAPNLVLAFLVSLLPFHLYHTFVVLRHRFFQVLGLGDDAAVVKVVYGLLSREKLASLLAVGSGADFYGNTDQSLESDEIVKEVKELIRGDAFLAEQAPEPMLWKDLSDPESFFYECNTAAEVGEAETAIMKRIGATKIAIQALRRSMKDCCAFPGLSLQLTCCLAGL